MVGRGAIDDGSTLSSVDVGSSIDVELTGLSLLVRDVCMLPEAGNVVVRDGRTWPRPDEIDVVRMLTLGTTSEVLMSLCRKIQAEDIQPNENGLAEIAGTVIVTQFVTVTKGLQESLLLRVGAPKTTSACKTVNNTNDDILDL
jgi:hypothetical protein